MAKTQNQPKSKENVNLNQPSTLRSADVCAYHCAQLSYTNQHRTVLTILPLTLRTIIIAQSLRFCLVSTRGRECQAICNVD